MKKFILMTALSLSAAIALQAADAAFIKGIDDKDIDADSISSTSSGDLEFIKDKVKSVVKKGKYKYAWIPKPKEIVSADTDLKAGKFLDAAEKYKKAFETNKLLGWDLYCVAREAECLSNAGQKEDALKRLLGFKDAKLSNPKLERDLLDIQKLCATLMIDAGDTEAALPLLDTMIKSKDDDIASFAIVRKGDYLDKRNERKDAVLMYLQAALLFPKSPYRAEALLKAANTLKELKDPRSKKFADMLKAEYPNDPQTKLLK